MNKISDQIMEGMKTAMKAKDTVTLNTLRALKTALTNTAIAKGGLGTLLEEAEELAVVRKQIKQREDSAEQFRSAGRPELAEKEEAEIAVLKQFMPAELTAEETAAILETVMKETGASTKKDMGQVMKLMQERTAGRVNGKELARMVSARSSTRRTVKLCFAGTQHPRLCQLPGNHGNRSRLPGRTFSCH